MATLATGRGHVEVFNRPVNNLSHQITAPNLAEIRLEFHQNN